MRISEKIKEKHQQKKLSPGGQKGSKAGSGMANPKAGQAKASKAGHYQEGIPGARTEGAGDLFPGATGAKAIDGQWVTAIQIYALTGLTDAELRRLANGNNPNPKTGAAWIPKPVRGKYNFELTLIGVVQWLRAEQASKAEHPVYPSMEVADSLGLIPLRLQKRAKRDGVPFINPNRSVQSEPLRRYMHGFVESVLDESGAPKVSGIDGFEEWDRDTELAKKLYEERIKLEDEREIRQKMLVNSDVVEEEIYEKRLGPARDVIVNSAKNLKREHRTILAAANVPAEVISTLEAKTGAAFNSMFQIMASYSGPKKMEKAA